MPHSYESYDEKASTYTALRRALAAKRIAQFISGHAEGVDGPGSTDLSNIHLLDSGCGTGNYTVEFIKEAGEHVYNLKKAHCTDFNMSMVKEAWNNVKQLSASDAAKTSVEDGKLLPNLKTASGADISFSVDNVCDMPAMETGKYDAVINNQVIHHLRPDNDFSDLKAACKEWYRVLRAGGRISINFSPPVCVQIGMWWAECIPDAFSAWEKRAPTVETMRNALEEAGFEAGSVRFEHIYDEILYDPALYFDLDGFVEKSEYFAKSDSTFALCKEGELAGAVEKIKKLKAEGQLEAWFERKNWQRKQVGQTVCVFALKKS